MSPLLTLGSGHTIKHPSNELQLTIISIVASNPKLHTGLRFMEKTSYYACLALLTMNRPILNKLINDVLKNLTDENGEEVNTASSKIGSVNKVIEILAEALLVVTAPFLKASTEVEEIEMEEEKTT